MVTGSICLLLYVAATAACVVTGRSVGGGRHHRPHRPHHLRRARVAAIQDDLLQRLQMNRVPRVGSGNSSVEEQRRVLLMYRDSIDQLSQAPAHSLFESSEYLAREFHSFRETGAYPAGVDPGVWNSQHDNRVWLYFPLDIPQPQNPNREKVTHSASLKIMAVREQAEVAEESPGSVDHTYRVNLYQLLEPASASSQPPRKRLVDSTLVHMDIPSSWLTFNIRPAVQSWLQDPSQNFGLELTSDDGNLNRVLTILTHRILTSEVTDEPSVSTLRRGSHLSASLQVYTQTHTIIDSARQRRSQEERQPDCTQGDGERRCCRYPLWVSFRDLGWDDWIKAPAGFHAYFCDGSCPFRHRSAHMFTDVQSYFNIINPKAAPAPCCTATKLRPLTLVHYNEEDSLVVSTVEDMIVEQCMCA